MSDHDQQEVLLMAIEYLKGQYESLQNPCIALLISRYYRLLSALNIAKNRQEGYAKDSRSWAVCHTTNPKYSQKMQHQLHELTQLSELTS